MKFDVKILVLTCNNAFNCFSKNVEKKNQKLY